MTSILAVFIVTQAAGASPIVGVIPEGKENATFVNALHVGNRIGYRFHEHTPMIYGDVPTESAESAGRLEARGTLGGPGRLEARGTTAMENDFAGRANVLVKRVSIGDADWAAQSWTFYMAPVDDGVELLWVVATGDVGLNAYYGVQQCFRLGGVSNELWRREYAETPAFSEYDLWDVTQKDQREKTGLTYVVRGGAWGPLPAVREAVGARTPLGVTTDTARSGGDLNTMPKVGPYDARMLDPIDCGLITRVDVAKTWVCGIYWEGTSHVTNHHPADCLHSIVNIGGVPPHGKRALRGKIYWFEGTLEGLLAKWRKDFSSR